MPTHPISPYLDIVRAALAACKNLGADVPAQRAQWAQGVLSTLELGKELTELRSAAMFSLLQMQLGMLGTGATMRTAQSLLETQLDATAQLHGQWKMLAADAATRSEACIEDLRRAESQDDVSFVMAGFVRDAETRMRKAAEESAMLCNSAGAATRLLMRRVLDDLANPSAQATQDTSPPP